MEYPVERLDVTGEGEVHSNAWPADEYGRQRLWHNGQEISNMVRRARITRDGLIIETSLHRARVQPGNESMPGMFSGEIAEVERVK